MPRFRLCAQTLRCLFLLPCLVAPAAGGAALTPKKVLEFGWDEPDLAFIQAHIAEMQRTPFDGCVFHVDYKKPAGATGSFTWQSWGEQAFKETDLSDAFTKLKAIHFGRFKYNFVRFNTTPAKIDWFDDQAAVAANSRLAAQLAKAGHCPGILFDIEQYEGQLFNYRKQRDVQTKSWELYAAQAHKRGYEIMQAFQEGYPGLTVFLTFGYSLPWSQSRTGKVSLADCSYGLLAPFLDGMVEAAAGKTRIVDGHELSYGYKTAEQFAVGRNTMKQDVLPIVRDADKYDRVISVGFGVWVDNDWRKHGWDTNDFSKNYFSPETFQTSATEALRAADEYVWIYSETPRWWSAEGKPEKLPPQYASALLKARDSAK
jgi:hypothetical protein